MDKFEAIYKMFPGAKEKSGLGIKVKTTRQRRAVVKISKGLGIPLHKDNKGDLAKDVRMRHFCIVSPKDKSFWKNNRYSGFSTFAIEAWTDKINRKLYVVSFEEFMKQYEKFLFTEAGEYYD